MRLSEVKRGLRTNVSEIDIKDRAVIDDIMSSTPTTNNMEEGIRPLLKIWQNDTYQIILRNEYMNTIYHRASFALKASSLTIERI